MNYNFVSDLRTGLDMTSFKSIINNLDDCKNIQEKDIIIGLYYSFYNTIYSTLEVINCNVAKEYGEYVNKTMNTVIKLSKGRTDNVSAESFIHNFLYYLSINNLSKVSPISKIIDSLSTDLDDFINTEKSISNNFHLVDKEFSLEEKAFIGIQYKDYISDLYIIFTNIYGVNNTVNVLDELMNFFDLVFPVILNISNDLEDVSGLLRVYTKDKLKEIQFSNKFDFFDNKSGFAYELIQNLNVDEKNVFELCYIYMLAGFNDGKVVNIGVSDDYMAYELGIDRKILTKLLKNIDKKCKLMQFKQFLGLNKTRKRKK